MATINDLTDVQIEILSGWWQITRHNTAGYYPTELQDRKPTLDALHRMGVVEQPHRGTAMPWAAKLTAEGEVLAKECAELDVTKCPECGSTDLVCSINMRVDFVINADVVTEYRVSDEPDGRYIASCSNPDCDWCDESGPEYEVLIDLANDWSNWGSPTFSTTEPVKEGQRT